MRRLSSNSQNRRPLKAVLENVTVQYGDAPPLFERLNLDIQAGSFVVIKGVDGSGRSSMLRLFMNDTPVAAGAGHYWR